MTVDQDAFTAPFMLTKAMHRDVYPAVDPVNNPAIQVEGKVVVVRGATGGLGFVSLLILRRWVNQRPDLVSEVVDNDPLGHRPVISLRQSQGCCDRWP